MNNRRICFALLSVFTLALGRELRAESGISRSGPATAEAARTNPPFKLFGDRPAPAGAGHRPALDDSQIIQRPTASAGAAHKVDAQPAAAQAQADHPLVRESDGKLLKRNGGSTVGFSIRDILPLLSVLALIAGLAFMVKRYMPNRRMLVGSRALEIIARTALSPKQSLVMVKMGRRLVLLGVSPERITALGEVEDPQEVALLVGEAVSGRPESMASAFAGSFTEAARAYDRTPEAEPAEGDEMDIVTTAGGQVQGLLSKLRRLSGNRHVA